MTSAMIQFMIYESWLYISFSMFDMYKLEYVYKHLICFPVKHKTFLRVCLNQIQILLPK